MSWEGASWQDVRAHGVFLNFEVLLGVPIIGIVLFWGVCVGPRYFWKQKHVYRSFRDYRVQSLVVAGFLAVSFGV